MAPMNDIKIPRPLNSYMIFRLAKQREIIEQCPGANHRDISKITSKWWRELSAQDRQFYDDEAKRMKEEHRLKYPDYKFSPKKRGAIRNYKKRPSNEMIALNPSNKRNLLALYHYGIITESSKELETQLMDTPKSIRRKKFKRKSNNPTIVSTLNDNTNNDINLSTTTNVEDVDMFNNFLYVPNIYNNPNFSPCYSSSVSPCALNEDSINCLNLSDGGGINSNYFASTDMMLYNYSFDSNHCDLYYDKDQQRNSPHLTLPIFEDQHLLLFHFFDYPIIEPLSYMPPYTQTFYHE